MEVLDNLLVAGDFIFNLLNGNSYILIIDNQAKIVKTWDVPHLPFGVKPGEKIPKGTVTHMTLINKKRLSVTVSKDKSRFGFGYMAVGMPIFNENNELTAILTVTSPILQQDQVKEISNELKKDIEQSNNTKKKISLISSSVAGTIENLTNIVAEFQQNISVINEVIHLINNVAGQTNLLGLNAAIEAARSVKHGKGFAVIAQEIRILSNTVKKSVKELNHKLSMLNNIIGDINPQVTDLNDFMSKQLLTVKEINTVTQRISNSTEKLDNLANESWF